MTNRATPPAEIAIADFPHQFAEPQHAELAWEWDDMHMPFALTPLAGDYATRLIGAGLNESYAPFGFPDRYYAAVWNGYVYYAYAPNVADDDRKAADERFKDFCRERAETMLAWWQDEAIPELERLYDGLNRVPVDEASGADLATAWLAAWSAMERAWRIHFVAIMAPYQVVSDLADLYEKHTPDAPPGEALGLIQGFSPDLFSVAVALDRVVATAVAAPGVAERLRAGAPPTSAELEALPGGPSFLAEVDAFLGPHGHLGQAYDDLAQPSYAEDPRLLLAEVAKRLERPAEAAADRRARVHEEAERLADGLRARLADEPAEAARFERLLVLGREIGHLTEGHNYWIDRKAQATLRRLVIRVGERLVRDGGLDEPEDILFLEREEVAEGLREPRDRRPVVAERRRALEHWRTIRPPAKLGKLEAPAEDNGRFGAVPVESTEAGVLRGKGASPGVVRGTARVALSNADFPRIQPGDVIVCPSSNPSWVPVFTVAGGLVTNTGGVLSHAAVVAREFALPAVVGVADATLTITDGQLIEIDGTLGTVRLL